MVRDMVAVVADSVMGDAAGSPMVLVEDLEVTVVNAVVADAAGAQAVLVMPKVQQQPLSALSQRIDDDTTTTLSVDSFARPIGRALGLCARPFAMPSLGWRETGWN